MCSFQITESIFNLFSRSTTQPTFIPKPFAPPTNSSEDEQTRTYMTQWAATYSFNYDDLHDPTSASSRYMSIAALPPCQFQKLNKYFDLTPLNCGDGPYFTGQ